MISNKHFSILSLAVLLALVVAAVLPLAALADDETPPPDAPVTEEVVLEEVPAGDETQPAADETAVEEAPVVEDLSVSEALEQLPEDTALVVVDENGEALPLASQEAAEVVASADPYFRDGNQYVGYSASGICPPLVSICTQSDTPIQTAINAFGQSATADGYIFIEGGTYNEDVDVDAKSGNLSNLLGLVGNGTPTINGTINLSGMSGSFYVMDLNLNGSLYASNFNTYLGIYNVNVTSDQDSAIILKGYSGDVALDNVNASASCQGCRGVDFSSGTGDVTIEDSNFSSEERAAAKFYFTEGNVAVTGGNFEGPNEHGILFDNHEGNVTLNDVTASGAEYGGAFVVGGDVFINGGDFEGGQAATGFMVEGDVTVENATLHDSLYGIHAIVVAGTLDACNNVFSNNDTDIFTGDKFSGVFDGCSPVKPPVDPSSTALINQPFVADGGTKTYSVDMEFIAMHKPFSEGELPGSLPSNASFVAGKNVTLLNAVTGESVDEASGMWITLEVPATMRGQSIRVMFWNGSEWIEVASFISTDGKQITFLATKAGSYTLVTP